MTQVSSSLISALLQACPFCHTAVRPASAEVSTGLPWGRSIPTKMLLPSVVQDGRTTQYRKPQDSCHVHHI